MILNKFSKLTSSLIMLFLIMCLSPSKGFTQGRGGIDSSGGGHGILINSKIYLLDLVESNITDAFAPSELSLKFEAPLQNTLRQMQPTAFGILASKINLIANSDPIFATLLVRAILYYDWVIVPYDLKLIGANNLNLKKDIYQIAVREPLRITISKKYWDMMQPSHQAALVLHEVVSALAFSGTPQVRARQLIGAIFSNSEFLPDIFRDEIQASWPSRNYFIKKLKFDDENEPFILKVRDSVMAKFGENMFSWEVVLMPTAVIYMKSKDGLHSHFSELLNPSFVGFYTSALCKQNTNNNQLNFVIYRSYRLNVQVPKRASTQPPGLEAILTNFDWNQATLLNYNGCKQSDITNMDEVQSEVKLGYINRALNMFFDFY